MEKNRLFITIAAAVAIIGTFAPWASLNVGAFGSYGVNGLHGDGWLVLIAAIVSIVLACLNNVNTSLPKNFAIGVIISGAVATLITLVNVFNVNKYATNFGGYGVSIGFGLILSLLASIALVVTGLLAMSGGKLTKESFSELAESGKGFAQSVGRVTTATVKTAVDEIKKESQEQKKDEKETIIEAEAEAEKETVKETETVTGKTEATKEEVIETETKNEQKEEQKDPNQADK